MLFLSCILVYKIFLQHTTILMHRRILFLCFCAVLGMMVGAGGAYARDNFARRFWLYLEAEQSQEEAPVASPESTSASAASSTSISVPVLVYHSIRPYTPTDSAQVKNYSVEPAVFERQLQYLQEHGYAVVSLDALTDHLAGRASLPEKSVVLTLDDGWENQFVYAFPLLKHYGMSATFFIFTNAIGHRHFLTWDQVSEMASHGMVIGGHSRSHPYLEKIASPEKLSEEIAGSKKIIEDHIGRTITLFAYPFGQYNASVIDGVRQAGYGAARTLRRGMVHDSGETYTLHAMQVQNSMESLITALHGI